MAITIEYMTSNQARERQAEIRDTIGESDAQIRERGDRYEYELEHQLLAEEYIRLNLLLFGRR